jgi:hypothetical protein
LIGQATPRAIDLLRVDADGTPWWCANLASGGFGTQVTVETDAGLKKMLGGLAYVITGIAKLGGSSRSTHACRAGFRVGRRLHRAGHRQWPAGRRWPAAVPAGTDRRWAAGCDRAPGAGR